MARKTVDPIAEVTPAEMLDLIGRATDGSDVTAEEIAAFLAAGHSPAKQRRVLRWVSESMKRARKALGQGDPVPEVWVRPAHRGRVTGYSLVCLGCGLVASKLAPSKRSAELAAVGHLRADHESVGHIDVR